ncbi:E3 ubiquitin-protein ligase TRAIP-like [Armigeres subalbatus]|uniref:E3 ubiquitin-protein ligase TRAIP-like n=1 Tax=Armigeres subalbatus TaxID=124917 RepID=UPI002ED5D407
MNFSCTICTDIFVSSVDVHVTPCGHAFHYACILQWLERSKSCPECRNKCIAKDLTKLYLNDVTNGDNRDNVTLRLQNLDNMKLSLREKDIKIKRLMKAEESHKGERNKLRKKIASLQGTIEGLDCVISTLRSEVWRLRGEQSEYEKAKEELEKMEKKMRLVRTIEFAIDSSSEETEALVASNSNRHTLAVLATSLKRELQASEFKREELRNQVKSCQNDLNKERKKYREMEDKLSTADSEIHDLRNRLDKTSKKPDDSDDNSDANIDDEVRKILESDSPFLPIKSCAFGLHPNFLRNYYAKKSGEPESSVKRSLMNAFGDPSGKWFNGPALKDRRPSENEPNPSGSWKPLGKENLPFSGRIVTISRKGGSDRKMFDMEHLMLPDV